MTVLYLAVAISLIASDAFTCASMGCRYRIFGSIVACLLWPILLPAGVVMTAIITRDMPDADLKEFKAAARKYYNR